MMFKLAVLTALVVCSAVVHASPPPPVQPSAQRASGHEPPPACSCAIDEANASSTKTISDLTNSTDQQLATSTAARPTPAPTDCGHDSGYTYSETGGCYKYHAEAVNWTRANETCVREGAQLTVINGRGEARLLGEMATEHWPHIAFVGYLRGDDGEWRAVTGESVEEAAGYSPWTAGWPLGDESVSLLPSKYAVVFTNGSLYNVNAEFLRHFICEKRPLHSTPLHS